MFERIEGMPPGTIGFRVSGEIGGGEYRETAEAALREAAETGAVRLLFIAAPDFKMDRDDFREDAAMGLKLGLQHLAIWKRTAMVTDIEWVQRAVGLFAWLAPGEVETFSLAQLEEAKAWVAAEPVR